MRRTKWAIVTDSGQSYTTYRDWAELKGLKNYHLYEALANGTVVRVVQIGLHLNGYTELAHVRILGEDYIIGVKGLTFMLAKHLPITRIQRLLNYD